MAEELNEEEQMIVNQEYKQWKKQSPSKYDFCLLHSLEWPSYTFEWLNQTEVVEEGMKHYAIASSCATNNEPSHLLKVSILIPHDNKCTYRNHKDDKYIEIKQNKINTVHKIPHVGQINRARRCPSNEDVIACSANNGQINLLTIKDGLVGKLVGHSSQGYGLCWNNINHSILASGQTDKRICIWDVEKNKQGNHRIQPIMQILHHNAPVEDVAWHKFHPNIFASCSDDRLIMMWDMRFRSSQGQNDKKPLFEIIAHTNQVYSLDFSPFNQFLFLSGSGDEAVSVWDTRNLTRSLQSFKGSSNSVIKVQWSPFVSTIFASCGYDRKVAIWDLSKDKKQKQQDQGLLFVHGGHRSRVLDFDWNKNQKLLIGSVQQSNSLHVWQMSKAIYYEEDDNK